MELGRCQLMFERILKNCTTISTMDNGISEGTRSTHIVISEFEGSDSTVPIELFPSRIPLTILDDDSKYQKNIITALLILLNNTIEVNFIISSNSIIVASEGERVICVINFQKTGNTSLTYNVTLKVNARTSSASNQ